ncbi:MAG: hypothetical protein HOL07_15500 [Rhodospirillaceae bacterium]|jgi:TfoX/Sxy family transcriptional regulator of competence genes|nr:hypothetical protein [Rhodospirillaceae bacterium]MBT5359746.1 hypothetical protein [Rhodospirillaceae bacterium]MBT5944419.1 hypothetical protein [Rhodospirillaceae bacterium]MBT6404863.1 hypothetical protein [Rhodospirillaceae bacterium]MBT7362571.1 hypothetical protein [Rhodospirillaceae bacterium]
MAQPYLDNLTALLERTAPDLGEGDVVECRHFFSGAATYVNGRIFMSLTPVGLALKLSETRRDALMAAGGTALRYFPKGPVKTDYVVLPETLTDAVIATLIVESAAYARAQPLPTKKTKTKARSRSGS